MRKWMIAFAGIVTVAAVLEWYGAPARIAAPPRDAPLPAQRQVTLEVFSGTKNGQVFFGTFAFANKGETDVKNIRVKCTHYGPGGQPLDAKTHTINEIVKAKSSKTIRSLNMGLVPSQAVSSSCAVADYVSL